jgi:hypothetical protein
MRKYLVWVGVALLAVAPARAEPVKAAKTVKETWDAVYIEGARCGYVHTLYQEVERGGKKVLVTTLRMNLAIKRYNSVVPVRMELTSEETADGKVLALAQTQYVGKDRLVQIGRVEGDKLVVRSGNEAEGKKLPWNDKAIGMARQDQLFREHKVKPGDRFDYLNYELALATAVPVRVTVKEVEETDLLEAKKDGMKIKVEHVQRKLLRAEAVSDKVEVGGQAVQLPKLVSWLDKDLQTVRFEMDLGLGVLTGYRTTKEVAQQEGVAPSLLPDLGLGTLITLNKAIDRVHDAKTVVYRVKVKGTDDPTAAFTRDSRQQAKNVKGDTFELEVRGGRGPVKVEKPEEYKKECLASNYFVNSDDVKVKELAAKAVGDEKDPWRRALRIEKWVHENMKISTAEGFPRAGDVARDLRGDCRQHALLTAALCRAAGLPARTAVGLVYVPDPDRGPVLGFHMWAEVGVQGQWLGLDAVLGRGGVGPGHLKMGDHTWADTQTLAPLLPVTRHIGKLTIEVVRVTP